MNEKIEEAVNQLVSVVVNSSVYKEYEVQKNKINMFPELKTQLDEFRARNYEMQNSGDCALEKLEQFEREYDEFLENQMVSDFLAAEVAFCRMMQDINRCIMGSVNFE